MDNEMAVSNGSLRNISINFTDTNDGAYYIVFSKPSKQMKSFAEKLGELTIYRILRN